jgi:hypothetical protein
MKTMKKLKIYFLSNNIYRGMTGIMGVNRVGLKRRPTFEEIINTENFKPKYPGRSYKFLRNSPQMTQFDNMGMFEFDDYYQRERVQRQMHDLMSSISQSSNLTVDQLKSGNTSNRKTET